MLSSSWGNKQQSRKPYTTLGLCVCTNMKGRTQTQTGSRDWDHAPHASPVCVDAHAPHQSARVPFPAADPWPDSPLQSPERRERVKTEMIGSLTPITTLWKDYEMTTLRKNCQISTLRTLLSACAWPKTNMICYHGIQWQKWKNCKMMRYL